MIRFYFDEQVHAAIGESLATRGIDGLSVLVDGRVGQSDELVLLRSIELGRIVVTSDNDFYALAIEWIEAGRPFPGIIFFHARHMTVGEVVRDLELIATVGTDEEFASAFTRLPI